MAMSWLLADRHSWNVLMQALQGRSHRAGTVVEVVMSPSRMDEATSTLVCAAAFFLLGSEVGLRSRVRMFQP